MPPSVFPFARKIAMSCACIFVLVSSATAPATASSALAAPLDAPVQQSAGAALSNSIFNVTSTSTSTPTSTSTSTPTPTSSPAPQPAPTADPGAEVADFAEQYVGSPYRWGGSSPSGFDCTGFVMWVYSQFGVALPHNEAGQLASGDRVNADDLQPGDVLVFANTYRAGLSHTGIYLGDGQFVHAADERHGVTVSALWDGYWAPRLVGASRAIS